MFITESQLNAFRLKVVGRWEQYQSLPDNYTVIEDNDPRGNTIGIWVGPVNQRTMYLAVTVDGSIHT
jgi:hypothetical protein